jgi:NADPH oxidase
MVALCLHAVGCFVRRENNTCKPYGTWQVALVGFGIYVLERVLREVRSRQLTYITKVVKHPSDVVEIQFRKNDLAYLPGQYIFICVPDISSHQWHPFTLTSAPEEDYISIHIRIVGDWTESLARRLGYYSDGVKLDPQELPYIRVDGPFGTPSQQAMDYDTAVFVGGGIGVTPFASLLKSIWYVSAITFTSMNLFIFTIIVGINGTGTKRTVR